MSTGSLAVVGTGIKLVAHATIEARQYIENADCVRFVVADGPVADWIHELNANAKALNPLYEPGKPRIETYQEMIDAILTPVREGKRVCAVFYGHPGTFVYPSHEAVRQAREEGYDAFMAPAVSAEDCLFADLGVDPATQGCQSYEATNFLLRKRIYDPYTALVIWQIGVIGDSSVRERGTFNVRGVDALVDVLAADFGKEHPVTVYEAAQWPISQPKIETVALGNLRSANITPISTLYVPPLAGPPLDDAMFDRLGVHRKNNITSMRSADGEGS